MNFIVRRHYTAIHQAEHSQPISSLKKTKMSVSSQIFSDLPAELIHIILCYYTHSFKDLIKFSTINKTCKQISDHSLLWLEVKLMFYPPKQFILREYDAHFSKSILKNYEEFVESLIRFQHIPTPILEIQLYSNEKYFPPVYRVQVTPFQQKLAEYKKSNDISYDKIAFKISKWWKRFCIKYQQLYHWNIVYYPYFRFIESLTKKISEHVLFVAIGTVCVGIISIYLLFDCNDTNLSLENKIGFYLLLGIVGFYMILNLIYMMNALAERQIYNYETLRFRFNYSELTGFYENFIALGSIFISLTLVLLKCTYALAHGGQWWQTVLPLWIGSCLLYWLYCFSKDRKTYDDIRDVLFKVLVPYLSFSPPLTCTLVACYYDKVYRGPFQYTLFPLYPMFLLVFFLFGFRIFHTYCAIRDIARGVKVAPVFSGHKWLNYFAYLCVLTMTNISTLFNSLSVVMLFVNSYMIDDNDWDKGLFSVHFTSLTCFLLFLLSCPCIVIGFSFENMFIN